VVGSGIFVLPASVAALLGRASPAAYLVSALLTALVVLCFAEAGGRFDQTGGPYIYARAAFGSFVGFEVGWMFFLSRLGASAAIANAFAAYLAQFWPAAGEGFGRAAVITAAFAAFAALNVRGVAQAAWTVDALTVAKFVPLLVFVGLGLGLLDGRRFSLAAPVSTLAFRQAALLLVFAFGGFENANVPAEEAKNPRRDLPIALVAAIGLTAVLYVLIQMVTLSVLSDVANRPRPLADAGRVFLGPWGGHVIAAGAVLSTAGSLGALSLVGPRILYALSIGRQLPSFLSHVHPSWRTPDTGIVVFTLMAWAVALVGSFEQLVGVSAIARLVFSAATCLAVLVLRRRPAEGEAARGFHAPGGPVVPLAAVALSVWLLTGTTPDQQLAGAIAVLAGGLLFLLSAWRVRSATPLPGMK
jgi:basic amino acid/polyamine antiporter, APA family